MKKISLFLSFVFMISLVALDSNAFNEEIILSGDCYICDALGCAPQAGSQWGGNACIDVTLPGEEGPNTYCSLSGGACGGPQ